MTTINRWTPAGVDYCTQHHGIRNEDDRVCDFHDDSEVVECTECAGEGCVGCEGDGVRHAPCNLRPLHYQEAAA